MRIKNELGDSVTAIDRVGLINYPLNTIFRSVEFSIQQKEITSAVGGNYPYKSEDSEKCGYFCMYVSDLRLMGMHYVDIMKTFNVGDLAYNDKMVYNHLQEHITKMWIL